MDIESLLELIWFKLVRAFLRYIAEAKKDARAMERKLRWLIGIPTRGCNASHQHLSRRLGEQCIDKHMLPGRRYL